VLATLVRRREELNAAGANFMQALRDSEFLNAIKHRSAIPGGTCEFDLPDYTHWLNQPAARRELRLRDDQLAVLFVGHDFRRKGLATAAGAIERLAARGIDARLLVVGGNHRGQRLPMRPLRAGLLLPLGAQRDPLPFYAAADVFVLPSYYDPFGLVVLEAAACGLPVITTRCTGASELLCDGREGYLLDDPGDAAAVAERLALLADPQRRRAMGAAARRTAAAYNVERNYRETLAVYREAVERREAGLRAA